MEWTVGQSISCVYLLSCGVKQMFAGRNTTATVVRTCVTYTEVATIMCN